MITVIINVVSEDLKLLRIDLIYDSKEGEALVEADIVARLLLLKKVAWTHLSELKNLRSVILGDSIQEVKV